MLKPVDVIPAAEKSGKWVDLVRGFAASGAAAAEAEGFSPADVRRGAVNIPTAAKRLGLPVTAVQRQRRLFLVRKDG